jgi:hypothetical protein
VSELKKETAARSGGRFVLGIRSPDGAKRNPGQSIRWSNPGFRFAPSGLRSNDQITTTLAPTPTRP